jgi:hypothetical protein
MTHTAVVVTDVLQRPSFSFKASIFVDELSRAGCGVTSVIDAGQAALMVA